MTHLHTRPSHQFTQHRFLGSLNLSAGAPPSQFVLYNHVTDYYFYPTSAHFFLPMRETLITFLSEELHYELIAIFNASDGLLFARPEMQQRYNELLSSPPKPRTYPPTDDLEDTSTSTNPTQPITQAIQGIASQLATTRLVFQDFGRLLRQVGATTKQTIRTAVIIERIQNIVPRNPGGEDRQIVDQLQSWSTLTNGNISILIADTPLLDNLPQALIGAHRSGVILKDVGLPAFDEINHLLNFAKDGLLSRAFGEHGAERLKIIEEQRRDLISRFEGRDILTIRSFLRECLHLDLPLSIRTLREVMTKTTDVWARVLHEPNLKTVEVNLQKQILGQESALNEVFAKLRAVRSDLAQQAETGRVKEGLLAYFFFAGPTGVGKTEIFRALVEHFSEIRARKFNMPEYKDRWDASRFFGAAPGYTGHGPGELGGFLLANPAAIVLFDEFEKAHPEVWKNFLTMLEGSLTTGDGQRVDLSQAVFIFTSNAGAAELKPIEPGMSETQQVSTRSQNLLTVQRALRQAGAAPELVGRLLASIVPFNHMTEPTIKQIIALQCTTLAQQMNVSLFDSSIEAYILDIYAEQGRLGARMVVQQIQSVLKAEVSRLPEPRHIIYRRGEAGIVACVSQTEDIVQPYQRRLSAAHVNQPRARIDPTNLETLRQTVLPTTCAVVLFDDANNQLDFCSGCKVSADGLVATRSIEVTDESVKRIFIVSGSSSLWIEMSVAVVLPETIAILRPLSTPTYASPYLLPAGSGTVDIDTDVMVYGYTEAKADIYSSQLQLETLQLPGPGQIHERLEREAQFRLTGLNLQRSCIGAPLIRVDDGAMIGIITTQSRGGRNGRPPYTFALMSSAIQAVLRELAVTTP